ncbi:hypothetical protein DL96DRAFT_1678637 [Flagelloscypha sp. PMI_526]|nr:hypothetical protein DL96DRAFT_1678637 [Flagelloscypha sp. PMI_526]
MSHVTSPSGIFWNLLFLVPVPVPDSCTLLLSCALLTQLLSQLTYSAQTSECFLTSLVLCSGTSSDSTMVTPEMPPVTVNVLQALLYDPTELHILTNQGRPQCVGRQPKEEGRQLGGKGEHLVEVSRDVVDYLERHLNDMGQCLRRKTKREGSWPGTGPKGRQWKEQGRQPTVVSRDLVEGLRRCSEEDSVVFLQEDEVGVGRGYRGRPEGKTIWEGQ